MFFDKHREKYAKLDSIKSISLEINYFAGTCFKKYTHPFFFQVAKVLTIPIPTFCLLYFYMFPFAEPDNYCLIFLGSPEIKSTR